MTKKFKTWLIIALSMIVVMAVALTMVFVVFKKKDTKVKLDTPVLTLQLYDTEKYLVCSYDPNAVDYAFYIYSDGDYPDRKYDYIEYLASENKKDNDERVSSYFDVTEIFSEPKDYYYFCKAIGSEKFLDSNDTEIQTYSNKYKLSSPQALSISGTTLSWRGVSNANRYEIYEDGVFASVASTTQTTFDVLNYINSKSQASFKFYVVAVGEGNYETSEKSNFASYTKSYPLDKVTGLTFNKNTDVLSWNKVSNASKYEVILNGESNYLTNTNSLSLSGKISSTGDFTFKVRAIGEGIYVTGDYSEILRERKTEKLSSVTNLSLETSNDSLIITWDYPDNAITFTIKIDGVVHNKSFSGCRLVLPKDDRLSITIEIIVNGYDYYLDSNPVQQTFNI